ncbi:sulfotransferase family protein [Xanthomonas pisi]|uniref:sulfotransferase family protein n=1 Tax=Xanthomonas pisi TaxID=56457 RepID=UPI000B1E570E|nr:sulfotransferase family protein [Xanthomonas pisi]
MSDHGNASGNLIVPVLGMARSGSSATARVLSLCGGRLPESLLSPNRWNPSGYWEPTTTVQANARYLRDSGSGFFDAQLDQGIPSNEPLNRAFIAEITGLLRSYRGTAANAPLILKDPRIGILLPFWLEAMAAENLSPRIVIPVRHPNEVVSSLYAWKGVPQRHAAELWMKYNLLTERHSRHLPRVFVSYSRLLRDWRGEIATIAQSLGLPLLPNDDVDLFLDPGLRHVISDEGAVSTDLPWLKDVYRALSLACHGGGLDIALLDEAHLDMSRAQAAGQRPLLRHFGIEFGLAL